jgi:hypothetical protein
MTVGIEGELKGHLLLLRAHPPSKVMELDPGCPSGMTKRVLADEQNYSINQKDERGDYRVTGLFWIPEAHPRASRTSRSRMTRKFSAIGDQQSAVSDWGRENAPGLFWIPAVAPA